MGNYCENCKKLSDKIESIHNALGMVEGAESAEEARYIVREILAGNYFDEE
jgi:hypothetical protein